MTAASPRSAIALAACAFALPALGDSDRIVMQVTPAGDFRPADGRAMPVAAWRIDAAIAAQVIERFNARQTPAVLDYEHQTLHKETNGQPAPAAGWFESLEWRDGQGLFATIQLTARAREAIGAAEYRYFSPVFVFDRKTGAVRSLEMGALTNTPALAGMQPLELRAAATFIHPDHPDHEAPMNKLLTFAITALCLASAATEEDAIAALSARFEEHKKLRSALGVPDDANAATAVATCTALRAQAGTAPDPAKFVPVSVVEDLKTSLAALSAKIHGGEVDELVKTGLADGRLLPAQEQWARDLGQSNVAALSSYLATAQPIAALTRSQTRGFAPTQTTDPSGLAQDELAVCSATGVTPEAFSKAKGSKAA